MKKASFRSRVLGNSTSNLTLSKTLSLTCRSKDDHNPNSINLLRNSGIDFDRLPSEGIDPFVFAQYFIASGLLLNKEMHWYGFHTDHDFAYLLRLCSGEMLPQAESKFLKSLKMYFPNIYDVKIMADPPYGYKSSLYNLSMILQVLRDDSAEHQAGSDSKLTARCFFELKKQDETLLDSYHGEIYGLSGVDINEKDFLNPSSNTE